MSGTTGGLGRLLALLRRRQRPPTQPPAVFHLAHPKAGSRWVGRVLQTLAGDRTIPPEAGDAQFLRRPAEPGKIYPSLYLTREQFASVPVPENHRRFVVVRDLRDTLVAAYFAHKLGLATCEWGRNAHIELNRLSPEDGLLLVLDAWLPAVASFQWSWASAGEELVRYEDLLADDEMLLARVLLRHCALGVDPVEFGRAVQAVRFEVWAGLPGEDARSHERLEVAGAWRNHFTEKVARAVRGRYGSLIVATGYEKDERW